VFIEVDGLVQRTVDEVIPVVGDDHPARQEVGSVEALRHAF